MAGNAGGRNPSWLKMKKSALKSEKELKTSCEARHRKKKKSLVEPRGMRGSLRHRLPQWASVAPVPKRQIAVSK